MKLDAHQHFWNYSADQYPWIQSDWPIRRDFLPADLQPLLDQTGLDGSIAVQARQTLEESRRLLELADRSPLIQGVVGWVDLCSDRVGEQLETLAGHPKFVGVRHVAQDEPDDRFLCRRDFQNGIARLRQYGLTYDILIFRKQLPAALALVEAFPDQPFVLDHLAKPPICDGAMSPWKERVEQLAQAPNVMAKVSGLVTEANWGSWRPDDFKPYLDHVFECFGVERLMYGSDWPVCLLAGSYEAVHGLVADYVKSFSPEEHAGFFGGNAARFYGV